MARTIQKWILGCLAGSLLSVMPSSALDRQDTARVSGGFQMPLSPVETTVTTGFTISPQLGSSYFVAPSFRKQISPRLRLDFGARYTYYDLKPLPFSVRGKEQTSSVRVWAEGSYQINDKWFVSAYAMKDIGANPAAWSMPFYGPTEAYGIAVDYIPSESLRFRAEFNFTRGGYYSWYHPYDMWYQPSFGPAGHYRFPSLWMEP